MQTRLFERFDSSSVNWATTGTSAPRPGAPVVIELPREDADVRDSPGTVVIRSSKSAAYGARSEEFWIHNGLAGISFSELVRQSSGHFVLPFDPCSSEDRLLLEQLARALRAFVRLAERSGQRFTGNRINDVGKRLEYMIADALRSTSLEVVELGRPGYPDCMVRQGDRVTYLEIKTSASVQKQSSKYLKTFCFSSGKKISHDARHLLLKVQLEEEDSKIWKVVAWELRDLSTLKTRLKTEFNAGFADLADVRLLGSSTSVVRFPSTSGQTVLDGSVSLTAGDLARPFRTRHVRAVG